MRTLVLALCFAAAVSAQQEPREIVRRSVALDRKNLELSRSYTFLERREECDLDKQGNVEKREIRTYDVTLLEGSPYRRLLARNDRPLSAEEQAKEQEKLRKSIEERRRESPERRARRIAEWERKQEKQREPLKELPDAFDFRLAGEETLGGVPAWVIDATPKPGYKPKSREASWLPKLKARLWIEKAGYHWVKAEVEMLDTVSFGAFLVRLAKGSRVVFEQNLINNEVWLPKHSEVHFNARVFLVKTYRKMIDTRYSDYHKFQAESRVISTSEK